VADAPTETERMARLKELYDELLTYLIDEQLIRQLARETGIRVTDADVDQAIENLRVQNNLTEEQLQQALESQGMSQAQYRSDLRKQLLRFKVMNERVRARVNITEEEVRARYEQKARETGSEIRFDVSHVVIPVEAGSTATEVAAVRMQAETVRATLTPDNFAEKAAEIGGGDLGWISAGDLPEDLRVALGAMQAGQIGAPVLGSTGFHIFFVKDKQVGSNFPSYDEMKQELYREMLDSAMLRQEKVFLNEIRRKAVINRML
jgi:peptidyl-prolyl cis-trans isomerase SurA